MWFGAGRRSSTGALGCSELSAWVSSKSSEWPKAPFSSAAAAAPRRRSSPSTVQGPPASSPSRATIARIAGLESQSRAARMAEPAKSAISASARPVTSAGIARVGVSAAKPASPAVICVASMVLPPFATGEKLRAPAGEVQ